MAKQSTNDLGFDVPDNGASDPSQQAGNTPVTGADEKPKASAATPQPAPPKKSARAVPAAKAEEHSQYDVSLNADFGKALAELQRVEALPSRNPTEERLKAAALAKIRPHVHALQQGMPTITFTAHDHAKEMQVTNKAIREKRIQDEIRTNPLFKELYEEYQRVLVELDELKSNR